ncbi:MAG: hypothetical protein WDM86_05115 [Rhizomicrobium sp.]
MRFEDYAMRALGIGFAVLLATAAPAFANGITTITARITSYAPADPGGDGIPTVTRGTQFAIACDGIRSSGADVRVVMSLDAKAGDAPTGYSAVLATRQTVARHTVQVQVPDVPDLANHTVNVRVYVTDAKGTKACDAGRVRIV